MTEGVYWPPLPSSLIEEAKSLATELQDAARRAAILARFDESLQKLSPQVVITHSPYFQERFQAAVVLEFPNKAYHYLSDGNLHRFDSELVTQ